MPAEFIMERQGKFRVRSNGPNHCGMNPGPGGQAVRYILALTCTSGSLDERGFLFDQSDVDEWITRFMDSRGAREASCEKLGERLFLFIKDAISMENPRCVVVRGSIRLSPYPYKAAVTCNWSAPKAARAHAGDEHKW